MAGKSKYIAKLTDEITRVLYMVARNVRDDIRDDTRQDSKAMVNRIEQRIDEYIAYMRVTLNLPPGKQEALAAASPSTEEYVSANMADEAMADVVVTDEPEPPRPHLSTPVMGWRLDTPLNIYAGRGEVPDDAEDAMRRTVQAMAEQQAARFGVGIVMKPPVPSPEGLIEAGERLATFSRDAQNFGMWNERTAGMVEAALRGWESAKAGHYHIVNTTATDGTVMPYTAMQSMLDEQRKLLGEARETLAHTKAVQESVRSHAETARKLLTSADDTRAADERLFNAVAAYIATVEQYRNHEVFAVMSSSHYAALKAAYATSASVRQAMHPVDGGEVGR